jgi:hypothetical protein
MEELVQLVLKTYGIAGLVMLSPFAGVVYLWRHNVQLQKELISTSRSYAEKIQVASEKTVDAQKQRVADAQAIMDRLVTMVGEQSSLNKETNLALERLTDLLSLMQQKR